MNAYVHRLYAQTLRQSPVCLMSAHWMRVELDELRKNQRSKMNTMTPYSDGKPLNQCFDELEDASRRLSAILSQRETGLMTWNRMTRDLMVEVQSAMYQLGFKETPKPRP